MLKANVFALLRRLLVVCSVATPIFAHAGWLQVSAGYGASAGTSNLEKVTSKIGKVNVSFTKPSVYSLGVEGANQSTSFLFESSLALSNSQRSMNYTQFLFAVRYYPSYVYLLPSNRPLLSFGRKTAFDYFALVGIVTTTFDILVTDQLGVQQQAKANGLGLMSGFGFDMPIGGNTEGGARFSDWTGLLFFGEFRGYFLPVSTSVTSMTTFYAGATLGLRFRL